MSAVQTAAPKGVLTEVRFTPMTVTIDRAPDASRVELRLYVGPLGDGVFMNAFVASLHPDLAAAAADQLRREASVARSGLVAANTPMPRMTTPKPGR